VRELAAFFFEATGEVTRGLVERGEQKLVPAERSRVT
jgi:hypothetical protein